MAARPVKVAFLADTTDLRSSLAKAEQSLESAGAQAKTAGQKIDGALDSTADSADGVASKGAQAAGALSGLGDLVGGKFGAAMMTGGVAMQAFADAGDLVNVVTESNIVRKIKDTAVTAAQTTASLAKAAADKVMAGAAKAYAAAQWLVNAAMSANPIGLLVIAIAALVAGFVIAYKKSEAFRSVVQRAFGAIKGVVDKVLPAVKAVIITVFDAIKSYFTVVFAIYKRIFSTVWAVIKTVTRAAFVGIKALIIEPIGAVVDYIKGVPATIKALGSKFKDAGAAIMHKIVDGIKSAAGFIGDVASGIWDAVKGMLNQAIGKINDALEFRIDLPLGKSVSINPHDIPFLASGGIVNRATLAVIGEAGPEAVIPLDKLNMGGGDYYQINLTVESPVGSSSADIGRALVKHIEQYERAGGRRRR